MALPLGSVHLAQPSWPGELGFANSTSTYSVPLTWSIQIGSLSSAHSPRLSFARPTWLGLPDLQMDFATWPIKFGPFQSVPHNLNSSMGSRKVRSYQHVSLNPIPRASHSRSLLICLLIGHLSSELIIDQHDPHHLPLAHLTRTTWCDPLRSVLWPRLSFAWSTRLGSFGSAHLDQPI